MNQPLNLTRSVSEVLVPSKGDHSLSATRAFLNTARSLTCGRPFSLEMSQRVTGTQLLLAADPRDLNRLTTALGLAYPQADFRPLQPAQDPAQFQLASRLPPITAEMTLRNRSELPIHTVNDLTAYDPLQNVILSSQLKPGEMVLSQLILSPAPLNWATRITQPSFAGQPAPNLRGATFWALTLMCFLAPLAILPVAYLFFHYNYLWKGLATLAISLALWGTPIVLWWKLRDWLETLDPNLCQDKVVEPGYFFTLRMAVWAETNRRQLDLLLRLQGSYHAFDLSQGNSFKDQLQSFDPACHDLAFPCAPSIWPWRRSSILTPTELAGLWHLPSTPRQYPTLAPSLFKQLRPPPPLTQGSYPIGLFQHQEQQLAVGLPQAALNAHSLILGKSQRGKSCLLQSLVNHLILQRDRAVILIDPHRDLAEAIAGSCSSDLNRVIYWDLADEENPIPFNPLNTSATRSVDKIISDLVDVFSRIWSLFWGPRMEDVFRWALLTLISASQQSPWTFNVTHVNRLLTDVVFRRLVLQFVSDPAIQRFWEREFDYVNRSFRDQIIRPVTAKINRFLNNQRVRAIFDQPDTGIDIAQVIDKKQILLIATSKGTVGADTAALVGSILLNQLRNVVAEREIRDRVSRTPISIIVDELQSLVSTTFEAMMSEVAKYGVNLILATQTLDLLDTFDRHLRPVVMSNQSTLISFETSATDASYLIPEFDNAVSVQDLTNLSNHTAYLKTWANGQRLPPCSLRTLPPPVPNQEQAEILRSQTSRRYGRARAEVEARRTAMEIEIQNAICDFVQTSAQVKSHSRKSKEGQRQRPASGTPPLAK